MYIYFRIFEKLKKKRPSSFILKRYNTEIETKQFFYKGSELNLHEIWQWQF